MNVLLSLILLILLVLFITPISILVNESEIKSKHDKVADEIWSLEEDYISFFKEENHQSILALGTLIF